MCLYMHNSHSCIVIETLEQRQTHSRGTQVEKCSGLLSISLRTSVFLPIPGAPLVGKREWEQMIQGTHISSNEYFILNVHSRGKSNIIYTYTSQQLRTSSNGDDDDDDDDDDDNDDDGHEDDDDDDDDDDDVDEEEEGEGEED